MTGELAAECGGSLVEEEQLAESSLATEAGGFLTEAKELAEGDVTAEGTGFPSEGKELTEDDLAAEGGGFLDEEEELTEGDLAAEGTGFAEGDKFNATEGEKTAEGDAVAECGKAAEGGTYLAEVQVSSWVLLTSLYTPPDAPWGGEVGEGVYSARSLWALSSLAGWLGGRVGQRSPPSGTFRASRLCGLT